MTCTLLSALITLATAQCDKLDRKLEGVILSPDRAGASVLCRNADTGETLYFGTIKTTGCIKL